MLNDRLREVDLKKLGKPIKSINFRIPHEDYEGYEEFLINKYRSKFPFPLDANTLLSLLAAWKR